ncbi:hypothetical protein Cmtc_04290 [Cupriavidus sp. TKC]|nr:hypothetical protein Cmtc_04290 [Cupriavidus sp. TKC]
MHSRDWLALRGIEAQPVPRGFSPLRGRGAGGEGKRLSDNAPEYGSKRRTEADPVLGEPELPIELMRLQAPRIR